MVCSQCWLCKQLENDAKYCFCLQWQLFCSLILEFKAGLFAWNVSLLLTLYRWTDGDGEGQWLIQQITGVGRKGPSCPLSPGSCWTDCCCTWFGRLNSRGFGAASALGMPVYQDFQNVVTGQNIAFVNLLLFQQERNRVWEELACTW